MGDIDVMLSDGTIVTIVGDHLWVDAGIPGLCRCECGLVRHFDYGTGCYWYSLED